MQAMQAAARKDFARAVSLLAMALRETPNDASLWFNRAVMLQQLGRHEEALADYDKALALRANDAEAWFNRGVACEALKRSEDAIASYDRTLALQRRHLGALNNRGGAHAHLKRYAEALRDFETILAIQPRDVNALYNKANALRGLGRFEDALQIHDRALAINPNHADAWNNRGLTLEALERNEEALTSFRTAIARGGDSVERRLNCHSALLSMNRHEEALAEAEAALRLDPASSPAKFSKGISLLTLDRLGEGWPLYEERWFAGENPPRPNVSAPLWLGHEDIAGKTVLLHAEQGLGDMIQFARFAAPIAARGAHVILRVPMTLKTLLREGLRAPGVETIGYDDPLPAVDFLTPIMSAALVRGVTPETIPSAPYIDADPARVAAWRARLPASDKPLIGIVWRGDVRTPARARRTIPLATFARLLDAPAHFVSLQLELDGEAEVALLDQRGVPHFGDALRDFADTAALIACCDLIITIDTSVAHLAGALGKPVWIMLRHWADWRWLLDRDDSPWYPSVRLFRQSAPGDWPGVITRVRAALEDWLATRR